MGADLDTLATALYVRADDLLKACPQWAPWRPATGICPRISDAELVTLAVMQAVLATREYLAGPFSIADLSNAAMLRTLRNRLPQDPAAAYDRVRAWYDRVTSRPAWQQVVAG